MNFPLLPSTILRLEALRFTLTYRERRVFDRVADGGGEGQVSGVRCQVGALVVRADYTDLAEVIWERPDKVGKALKDLAELGVLLPLDWAAVPGALWVQVNFNFAQWKAKPRAGAEVHWRRVGRLFEANGLGGWEGLPPWLIEPERDLKSELPGAYRELFLERIERLSGSSVESNAKSSGSNRVVGGPVPSSAGAGGSTVGPRSWPAPGALPPESGWNGAVRTPHPDSGLDQKAHEIEHSDSKTPNRGIRIESNSSRKESFSRIDSNRSDPESGRDAGWRTDGFIGEKLSLGRAAVLRAELVAGLTATARQFSELFEADPDKARWIMGEAAALPHLNWRTQKPTNVARWFNKTVADHWSKLFATR